jgi:DNA-binding CsgD family transcriptional regulator/PAS domain-containing protein
MNAVALIREDHVNEFIRWGNVAPSLGAPPNLLAAGPKPGPSAVPRDGMPMTEAQMLSSLVGEIYDAAVNPSLWPRVLGRAADFLGGWSGGLLSKDATAKRAVIHHADGRIAQSYTDSYFETYVRVDPFSTMHFFAEIDEPCSTADLMGFEEFHQTRFWKEWAQPQGLVDFLAVVLDKSATSVALFGVFRHEQQGVVDDEMRRRMRLIAPHMRRAALIGRVIDLKATEAAMLSATLDGVSAGMLLVDATGRIVHANAAGHAMLATADMLRAAGGWLVAADPQVQAALREVFLASREGDLAIGDKGIAVPMLAQDGARHVIHVLPLAAGARRPSSHAAVAALFVRKAALEGPSPPEAIAKAYRLTPSELRVLLAVVEVGGAPEVAVALGVAETTVKFHLRRLFEKTGARRQADLVKLVAGFASPFAG